MTTDELRTTLRSEQPWSWHQLLAACGGDEELALERLAEHDSLGEYEDAVHPRAMRRGPREPEE